MRNDADKAIPVRQARKSLHRLIQGFLIQGAKAFVNEHRIELHAAGRGLNFIRKAQRKGKGSLKGFPAGKGFDAPLGAVVMVDDIQIKATLAAVVLRLLPAF